MLNNHRMLMWSVAAAALGGWNAAASAGWATVVINGAETTIQAATLPGLLTTPGNVFTNADVDAIHNELQAGGINTVGQITMMLANTARGTSLILLADGPGQPSSDPPLCLLGVEAVWEGEDTSLANLDGGGNWAVNDLGDGTQVGAGALQWRHELTYEALALTELNTNQNVMSTLYDLGMSGMNEQVFNLLTFTNGDWSVAATYAFTDNVISSTTTIIEIPAPASLALILLYGMQLRRRRY